MLFHTWEFAIFFAIVYSVYVPLRGTKYCIYWLFIASYFFYGWWNPLYLLLIVYSTALDYYAVMIMEKSQRKKIWLWLSLGNNLLILGFFKYTGFFCRKFNNSFSQIWNKLCNPQTRYITSCRNIILYFPGNELRNGLLLWKCQKRKKFRSLFHLCITISTTCRWPN